MSLTEPTTTEKVITAWKGWPMLARVGVPLVLLLVLIGAVLLGLDKCSGYITNRDIKKAKENVNIALKAVNAQQEVVANDRVDEAVALDHVKQAVNDAVIASTASDEAKAATNQAVANYVAQKASGLPTGTQEADLAKKLEALGE